MWTGELMACLFVCSPLAPYAAHINMVDHDYSAGLFLSARSFHIAATT